MHQPGPGVGLVIAWITVILLAFHWARVVWTRTAVQLAAEEHRRRAAGVQQTKGLLETLNPPEEPRAEPVDGPGSESGDDTVEPPDPR